MWVRRDGPSRQRIFVDIETSIPLSVTDDYLEEVGTEGGADPDAAATPRNEGKGEINAHIEKDASVNSEAVPAPSSSSPTAPSSHKYKWVPVMTYSWERIEVGEPQLSLFDIPPPWNHSTCTRHIGGWPSIHAFHHFLIV